MSSGGCGCGSGCKCGNGCRLKHGVLWSTYVLSIQHLAVNKTAVNLASISVYVLCLVADLAAALDGRKGVPPWEQLQDLVLELEPPRSYA
ncbi:hypothetical protein SLEP1_g4861 [Rubroshorea leprosula]|uniref:Metallothionein-like protein n=1 Tax=Rubroshorea leprosula TaxID=152421 RepID=A0AAV5HY70_9ROSI|nr:hypothetical protein SLEP1_g4861 [Rubroshorea leprosula]